MKNPDGSQRISDTPEEELAEIFRVGYHFIIREADTWLPVAHHVHGLIQAAYREGVFDGEMNTDDKRMMAENDGCAKFAKKLIGIAEAGHKGCFAGEECEAAAQAVLKLRSEIERLQRALKETEIAGEDIRKKNEQLVTANKGLRLELESRDKRY